MLTRALIASTIALIIMPMTAQAQEDALRAKIRAEIMNDARSQQMSETEVNTMIEALATEAEAQGVGDVYLDTPQSFDYTLAFAEANAADTKGFSSMVIAIVSLAAVLLSLGLYFTIHHGPQRPARTGG